MRKSKGQTIDLLYINKNELKKKNHKKKINEIKKKSNKKYVDNTKTNLDNEIIIGLTPKSGTTKNRKALNKKQSKKRTVKKQPKTNEKLAKSKKDKKKNVKIAKIIFLFALFIVAISLFLMSSLFNIKQIKVENNNRISSEEILKLSTLKTGINMFKIRSSVVRKNLKTNPYIENVKLKRNINGDLTLVINERVVTYMLKFANAYVYINNQGYILEMSENPLEIPVITGFATPPEMIKEGNRLVDEDLKKLEEVIRIMETAKAVSMDNIITQIDIKDSQNYKLTLDSEDKTVQFGDCSDVNIKLLKIQSLIEKEKGKAGEIYFQDSERTVFREKV